MTLGTEEIDPTALAKQILRTCHHMSLATSASDADPWVVIVGLNYDRGTLSWDSSLETRHSQYLARNPRFGFLVFDPTASGGVGASLYGRAKITSIKPIPGNAGRSQYWAEVMECWLQANRKINGEWTRRFQLDPKNLAPKR
jgi:hypothetical protein